MTENILPAVLIAVGILIIVLTISELRRQVNNDNFNPWEDENEY